MNNQEAIEVLKRIRDEAIDEFIGEWSDYEAFDIAINALEVEQTMSDIIQIAYGEPQMVLDNEVMKAVGRVGISVNKEELVKALELSKSLVRCQECIYAEKTESPITALWCKRFGLNDMAVEDDDYCSYGERRE